MEFAGSAGGDCEGRSTGAGGTARSTTAGFGFSTAPHLTTRSGAIKGRNTRLIRTRGGRRVVALLELSEARGGPIEPLVESLLRSNQLWYVSKGNRELSQHTFL